MVTFFLIKIAHLDSSKVDMRAHNFLLFSGNNDLVDFEVTVMTSSILKLLAQSLSGAHRGKLCVHVFIMASIHTNKAQWQKRHDHYILYNDVTKTTP